MPTHPSHHDPGNGPAGTTRTRLPEGGYATPRRPPARVSRTLVTVVGIIVLLIAALAFATRGTGSNGPTASSGTPSSGTAPQAAPTTPTGTHPVTGTTSGIPTGYPHTAQGAQSAAANYAVALGGDGMFTTATRHQIVSVIAAPSSVAKLQAGFDADYTPAFLSHVGLDKDGNAPQDVTFVNRTIPAGTKISGYSGTGATVSVWSLGLFGMAGESSTRPVTSNWFTVTFTLTWTGSDWKVLQASQTKGPTPVAGDDPISGANAIANAVQGYGGFTYAR